jgi:hypothetical protein
VVLFALAASCTLPTVRPKAPPTPPPPPPGVTRLELKGNVIRYGEKTLRLKDRIETWVAVLGFPSKTKESHYGWFGNAIEVSVYWTDDGRGYAGPVDIHLGENGYADGFVLQGVLLSKGSPSLQAAIDALSGTETPLWGQGWRHGYESAHITGITSPDGFVVSAHAGLDCVPHPVRGSTGTCVPVINDLTIEAAW